MKSRIIISALILSLGLLSSCGNQKSTGSSCVSEIAKSSKTTTKSEKTGSIVVVSSGDLQTSEVSEVAGSTIAREEAEFTQTAEVTEATPFMTEWTGTDFTLDEQLSDEKYEELIARRDACEKYKTTDRYILYYLNNELVEVYIAPEGDCAVEYFYEGGQLVCVTNFYSTGAQVKYLYENGQLAEAVGYLFQGDSAEKALVTIEDPMDYTVSAANTYEQYMDKDALLSK